MLTCLLSSAVTAAVLIALLIWSAGGVDGMSDMLKYAAVRKIITETYIGEADMQELNDSGFRAMIDSLDDNWSYYLTAADYERYLDFSQNSYTGIGVTVSTDEHTGEQHIIAVTPDSPAAAVGIEAGQVLLKVGSQEMTGLTTAQVRSEIASNGSDEFTLTLRSPDGTIVELSLRSGKIFSDPVSYELLDGGIGYIRLSNFETGSAEGFKAAVNALTDDGARGFVFDVRDNPGGKVSELMEILDLLLPEGDIFVMRKKDGTESVNISGPSCIELPMAVLINADSYSAAEFFAAALSEYEWAVTVGAGTSGKGRAQVTLTLPDQSAVHISNSVYLTPLRVNLSEVGGLTPDVEIDLSKENQSQRKSGRLELLEDEQIAAAIQNLNLSA